MSLCRRRPPVRLFHPNRHSALSVPPPPFLLERLSRPADICHMEVPGYSELRFIGKLLLKTLHLTCLIIISCRFQGFHFLILKRIFIPILIDYFLDQDCIFQLCTALFQMPFFFQLFFDALKAPGIRAVQGCADARRRSCGSKSASGVSLACWMKLSTS